MINGVIYGVGGADGDRTRYLVVANDALSQMSYNPKRPISIYLSATLFKRQSNRANVVSTAIETLFFKIFDNGNNRFFIHVFVDKIFRQIQKFDVDIVRNTFQFVLKDFAV